MVNGKFIFIYTKKKLFLLPFGMTDPHITDYSALCKTLTYKYSIHIFACFPELHSMGVDLLGAKTAMIKIRLSPCTPRPPPSPKLKVIIYIGSSLFFLFFFKLAMSAYPSDHIQKLVQTLFLYQQSIDNLRGLEIE